MLASAALGEENLAGPFHNDPQHPWNRLYRTLWVRTSPIGTPFGADRLDPLLWSDSRYLLDGESHRNALAVIDEFINVKGERLIEDPVKRAILQRDLWEIFDWSIGSKWMPEKSLPREREALQRRLAQIMGRLALFDQQIADLPDNYQKTVASKRFATAYDAEHPEKPFLPPDLFDPYGPWFSLTIAGDEIIAPQHLEAFDARSSFTVLFRHPKSREEGQRYFSQLFKFKDQWLPENPTDLSDSSVVINPKLPQFPAGTQLALVRRMLLPDARGVVRATPIVESIQLRVQRETPRPGHRPDEPVDQDGFEFTLTRDGLFKDGTGLRPVTPDEQDFLFVQFRGHGHDVFLDNHEPRQDVVMNTCVACHRSHGIFAMNSFVEARGAREKGLPKINDNGIDYQDKVAVRQKMERYDYGLLRGLILHAQ
jgi:hypothetical protein